MKKISLIVLLLSGCISPTSVDEKGRLEKVRIAVPAFFQIEMDYYKDQENKNPQGMAKTTSFTPVPEERIQIPGIGMMPKLMDMTKKEK